MFRKLLDQGQAGDNIGALLRGVAREDIERGQVLLNQVSVKPHTNSKLKFMFLQKKKVDVILHSSLATVHNFTSEQLT